MSAANQAGRDTQQCLTIPHTTQTGITVDGILVPALLAAYEKLNDYG